LKRISILIPLAALASVAIVSAQDNPFSSDAKGVYAFMKTTILRAAEKMPEEHYSFKTVPEVRTYGGHVAHVVEIQAALCGLVKGEKAPNPATGKTSKADLIAALKESFSYCDGAYNSMTDAAGAAKVNMFGQQLTKLGVLHFNNAHNYETYGMMVAYLRIKGIVPPSSEGRP
jgi:hypothetical protein